RFRRAARREEVGQGPTVWPRRGRGTRGAWKILDRRFLIIYNGGWMLQGRRTLVRPLPECMSYIHHGAREQMSHEINGELVPVGGGDAIPLVRAKMTLGRRESCDICMRFPNVSGLHAELTFRDGYWYVKDLNSTNGVKVNGTRVLEKLVYPKDEIAI